MEYAGIDVHKNETQICFVNDAGGVVREQRIRTDRVRLGEVFGGRPHMRILLEASTESEWVASCLEQLGHDVVVADPNFAAMYATRSRRVKTDKRDARTLADACRLGAYRPAHRTSNEQRHVRARLGVREMLVRTRARLVVLARSMLRGEGYRPPQCEVEVFPKRVTAMGLPGRLMSELAPLLAAMLPLSRQIAFLDAGLKHRSEHDADVARLTTAPAVGPVTAAAMVATVDDAQRFSNAHQFEAYIGLVPQEYSSGESQRRGPITKAGNPRMRWLLVQVAHSILRRRDEGTEALRQWAAGIAARRGKYVALVALARRMAGILFAMLRDGTTYQPALSRGQPKVASAA